MDDPLMADFKHEVQKRLTERMESTFGLTLDGISSLPSGEVAFGMIAVPNQIPGYILTMDVAEKRAATDEYLANLTQKLVAAGAKKSAETYKGQQITVLVFPPPEAPPTLKNIKVEIKIEPMERRAYYMFFQDVLIASDQLNLLKLIADRIAVQGSKSLADVEGYQVVMKRCIGDMPAGTLPIIRWYIDPLDYGESIRVLLRGSAVQNRRNKPSIFSILKQQGFDAICGIGGVITVKTEAQESVYRTFIYTKKPYQQAMRMLNFPDHTNFTPPDWMPADLARCSTLYVDPLEIFDNFGILFDALVMPGEEGVWKDILDGLERDPLGPKIKLREELLVHLGNRVMGMSRYEVPVTAESESIVAAVELKTGSESAMQAGIAKLFSEDSEMQGMKHNSYTIWHRVPVAVQFTRASGERVEEDRPPVFPNGGVVVAKNCLFVSTNKDYLKVLLDRLDTPAESAQSTINDETEYKEVERIFKGMGLADKPHFYQCFARTHETLRQTYEMIRQGQMAQSQAVLEILLNTVFTTDEESGMRRQIFDGSSMPEFEKIQHYFGTVGVYGVSEENGYFIKGCTLKPAEK